MSRIVPFNLQNKSIGEFSAICDRGYVVNGTSSAKGGASTSIVVSKDILETGWLRPGRMVLIEDNRLESWAGMIDMPVGLLAPATIKINNAEYLLNIRTPDAPKKITGTVAKIAADMITLINAQEETYLRMGQAGGSSIVYTDWQLEQRPFWEQLEALVRDSGSEMIVRSQREPTDGNRLYLYVDILSRVGVDTGFLLHDGQDGNVSVRAATLDRDIWNRVIGINGASAEDERLITAPMLDSDSIHEFRMRTKVQQFRNTDALGALNDQAKAFLSDVSMPVLKFDVMIKDIGNTFVNCRRGNSIILHASRPVLPDGRTGWRGTARIMAVAFNEKQNTLGATLEARYEFI